MYSVVFSTGDQLAPLLTAHIHIMPNDFLFCVDGSVATKTVENRLGNVLSSYLQYFRYV
jgi:hypothetical protein